MMPNKSLEDRIRNILSDFYYHATGVDDYGCKACKAALSAILRAIEDTDRKYPCKKCGKLRSKDEGGTVFTVCDECWDKP